MQSPPDGGEESDNEEKSEPKVRGVNIQFEKDFMHYSISQYSQFIPIRNLLEDADFSHNPNDLPRLYQACSEQGGDVSIGSRYISGVNVVNWPMGRVLMSYFASKYVRFITGIPVHDTTAGFVCYRRQVLEMIDLDHIRFKG